MEGNLIEALKLMVIGMCTVFCVLLFVIALGNLLIRFINKYVPEDEKPVQQVAQASSAINPNIAQAIAQAVNMITVGKGKVEKVEKL